LYLQIFLLQIRVHVYLLEIHISTLMTLQWSTLWGYAHTHYQNIPMIMMHVFSMLKPH
jgi:hypothetical protein